MDDSIDLSKSVDTICATLSMTNISVPRIDKSRDVREFINEFEFATEALPEESRLKLLAKAFPPGRYKSWYEREVAKAVQRGAKWKAIRNKIRDQYSDAEERDIHLRKLTELNFVEGKGRLRDFVEDLVYSFEQAFPTVEDDESKIRFVKSKIPATLQPELVRLNEYNEVKSYEVFMKGIRQFDKFKQWDQAKRVELAEKGEKVTKSELAELIKSLAEATRKEGEATRNVLAALRSRPREPSPGRARYERGQSPRRPSRESSPFDTRRRERSPFNPNPTKFRSTENQGNYQKGRDGMETYHSAAKPKDPMKISDPARSDLPASSQESGSKGVYDQEAYFAKYGKPPGPCSSCGYMHWNKHCLNHLN